MGRNTLLAAEVAAREVISLPVHPEMTDVDVTRVVNFLKDARAKE